MAEQIDGWIGDAVHDFGGRPSGKPRRLDWCGARARPSHGRTWAASGLRPEAP
jgi:hypothetical protein